MLNNLTACTISARLNLHLFVNLPALIGKPSLNNLSQDDYNSTINL